MWTYFASDRRSRDAETVFQSAMLVPWVASDQVGVVEAEVEASSPDYSCAARRNRLVCVKVRLSPSQDGFSSVFWTKTKNR